MRSPDKVEVCAVAQAATVVIYQNSPWHVQKCQAQRTLHAADASLT
jgi:hypothetical protein